METAIGSQEVHVKIEGVQSRWAFLEDNARLWMTGVLVLTDLFSLLVAIFATFQIRKMFGMVTISDTTAAEAFGLLGILLVVLFYFRRLYPGVGRNYVDELEQLVSSTSFTFLTMFGLTFLFRTNLEYSRMMLFVTWGLSLGLIPAARYVVRRLFIGWNLWGEPVVIIGNLEEIALMADYFKLNLHFGLRPTALLRTDQGVDGVIQAHNLKINTALVVINDLNRIDETIERFRAVFHRLILIKSKDGRYGLTGLQALDFSNILGLEVKNNLLSPGSQLFKRCLDVFGAFFGLLLIAPLLGLVAVLIKLDSPGRVFYRQVRVGRNGRPFTMLKFRSMHINADRVLKENLERDPALKAEWETYQKLKTDPRITRVGKFLRKFSLDEIPQLWNVLRAEMSLVGPRPILPNQREAYGSSYGDYILVTPGMTGLWQVSGRNTTTFARRAALDYEYIQTWSLWLDIYILAKTVKVVFWQNNTY